MKLYYNIQLSLGIICICISFSCSPRINNRSQITSTSYDSLNRVTSSGPLIHYNGSTVYHGTWVDYEYLQEDTLVSKWNFIYGRPEGYEKAYYSNERLEHKKLYRKVNSSERNILDE
jgi:antitoxin component YwqK of YwqJK toxin-antitoxin module